MLELITVTATINGDAMTFLCEPRQSLLEILRGELRLTGTKEGCSNGNCGACSVLLDGRVVNSCLVLAVEVDGRHVTTVEGLAREGKLSALQQAILEHAAVQCGFCTPGVLMTATALLRAHPDPTEAEIRQFLAGNLCRCTGYDKIARAVSDAAQRMKEATAL
ncbi:MAG TPA: (2Fe-2S)-binding protein [Symbiobacteriaceae bacterium]|nr:(2Fe-2S)-binding protein [Symbiobacteriaceae bacterium]